MGFLSETYDPLVCGRVRVTHYMPHPTPPSAFSRSTPWGPYREKCYILNGAFFMSALYAWLSVEVGLRISFTLIIKDPRIV